MAVDCMDVWWRGIAHRLYKAQDRQDKATAVFITWNTSTNFRLAFKLGRTCPGPLGAGIQDTIQSKAWFLTVPFSISPTAAGSSLQYKFLRRLWVTHVLRSGKFCLSVIFLSQHISRFKFFCQLDNNRESSLVTAGAFWRKETITTLYFLTRLTNELPVVIFEFSLLSRCVPKDWQWPYSSYSLLFCFSSAVILSRCIAWVKNKRDCQAR